MRLTLAIHPVAEIQFGDTTRLAGTRLEVNKNELVAYLLEDKRLSSVQLEIVRPGENCRIGYIFDVIEPRAKEPGHGSDFPGILGPFMRTGEGTTHVLRGAAVTVLDEGGGGVYNSGTAQGTMGVGSGASKILDMSGPAAEASPYSKL